MKAFQKPKRTFCSKPERKIENMKRLSIFNKIVFAINLVVVVLLLVACAVPYLTFENLPFLSFLSLGVPVLVGANTLFFLYWLIQGKRQMLYSLAILVFGYFVLGTFIKLSFTRDKFAKEDLKILSYNVHGFKKKPGIKRITLYKGVQDLVLEEQPDIICFQEVGYRMDKDFMNYPYHHLQRIYTGKKAHLGIFSKYPIIKSEIINFPNSINNGSYADIVYKNDTIRVYNIHMQSLGITPGTGVIRSKSTDQLYEGVANSFIQQLQQAKMIAEHKASSPYKTLVCGDFNNTQFSNVYHQIKGDMQDSFIEEGSGYGRTFNFLQIPLRIDFLLADESFEVRGHKNYDLNYSDHFPVMASFRLK